MRLPGSDWTFEIFLRAGMLQDAAAQSLQRGNGVQDCRWLCSQFAKSKTVPEDCSEVGCFDLSLGFPYCRFMFHVCCVLVLHL